MKREVDFHEVTVSFIVRVEAAKHAVDGFPSIRNKRKSAREKLASVVAAGIGGNEMNGLDVEELKITVDGKKCR